MKSFGDKNANCASSKRLAVHPPFRFHSFCDNRWKRVVLPIAESGMIASCKLEQVSLVHTKVKKELTVQFASKESKVGGIRVVIFIEPTSYRGH